MKRIILNNFLALFLVLCRYYPVQPQLFPTCIQRFIQAFGYVDIYCFDLDFPERAESTNHEINELRLYSVSVLPQKAFADLLIHHLNLMNISSLNSEVFEGISRLDFLEISSPNFLNFEPNSFKNLELMTVSFSMINMNYEIVFNNLKEISNLKNLEKLCFNNNSFETSSFNSTLTNLIVASFPNIQHIDLSANKLENVIKDSFEPLSNLVYLSLNQNNLGQSDFLNFASFKQLKTLEITDNSISNKTILKFPSQLSRLNLNGNQLLSFDSESVSFFSCVSLANNSIKNINMSNAGSELFLDLSHNQITDNLINKRLLGNFYFYLSLSHNQLKSCILPPMKNLHALDMSWNQIKHVSFTHCANLEFLDLSHNLIEEITEKNFGNLLSLKVLDLSHNLVREIDSKSFFSLQNFQTLDLNYNCLHVVPSFLNSNWLQWFNYTSQNDISVCPNVSEGDETSVWNLILTTTSKTAKRDRGEDGVALIFPILAIVFSILFVTVLFLIIFFVFRYELISTVTRFKSPSSPKKCELYQQTNKNDSSNAVTGISIITIS